MRLLTSLLLITLCLFSSCKETERYIDADTMASIIIDSKKAEVLVQICFAESNEQKNIVEQFNGDILKKYNISAEDYELSLEYYKNNPEAMEELIECLKNKNPEANVD